MRELDAVARLDATAQAALVAKKEVTALELVDACARRVAALDPLIRAVVTLDLDRARDRARSPLAGPFAGVPTLVKDVAPYPGMRCTFGSRLFAGHVPAEHSPFTARLDAMGLVTVGASASSEMGLLGSTETLAHGATHDPWDLSRSAAGSSGGAAAAVAAGLVPIAHASDAGGSIRIPASVCGLFGFKPSKGRSLPTGPGGNPFAELISEGCITRSVRDSATFFAAMQTPGAAPVTGPVKERLRIRALGTTLVGTEPDAAPRRALEDAAALLRELGHDVAPMDRPAIDGAALGDAFFLAAGAAMAGLGDMMAGMLGRPLGREDLEPFTLSLIEHFRAAPAGALDRAGAALAEAARGWLAALEGVDAVLSPTLAVGPWPLGWLSPLLPREELVARTTRAVGYTPIHNVAGCPAMSLPLAWSDEGLPLGVHLSAAPGRDELLLALAFELEAARPWSDRWPPLSFPRLVEA